MPRPAAGFGRRFFPDWQAENPPAEGRELDVGYSQRGPDRPRSLGEAPRGRDVVPKKEGEFAFAEGEPAVFRHGGESFEQTVSPLQPAARDSRFAAKGEGIPAEPNG